MEEFRLVICDIDGTLVPDDRQLTPYTRDVIRRLHHHGIYFGIASGRSIDQQLMKQAYDWGFDFNFEVLIGMNGSELYDGVQQKRTDYYKLKREWIKEIIELMAPFDLNPFLYSKGSMLSLKLDDSTRRSSERNRTAVRVAKDVSEMYEEENAKIMFRVKEEQMPEIEAYVNAHPSPHYKAFKTQTTMLEFSDRRVSKAVALKHFCEQNNLPLSQVMAFGDMSNDNEMLQCSGLGVCLLNGGADTKAIADVITERDNNHDGFAHFMEETYLKPRGW